MILPQSSLFPYRTATVALIVVLILFYAFLSSPWRSSLPGSSSTPSFFHSTSKSINGPKWLLAIFLAPTSFSRRSIIRSTWATRFPHPSYEYRFIIGNYSASPQASAIETENTTYGDIWALDDLLVEDHQTANRIKNMEFFKYMVQHEGTRVRRYEFVSKVDDDNWLNIPPYYDTFIAPRLSGGKKHNPEAMTVIGRPMVWTQEYAYASGRMYTISWPLLEFFVQKYAANPISTKTEDELMGLYLYENKTEHEFVPVELEQAWDIGLEYLVNNDTQMIHCVKHDERLQEISTMFDERGRWNGKLITGLTNFNRTMREVEDRIKKTTPEELQQLQKEWENGGPENPSDRLDWEMILANIAIEDREAMGNLYPLNLPGNNVSTGIVPKLLGPTRPPAQRALDG